MRKDPKEKNEKRILIVDNSEPVRYLLMSLFKNEAIIDVAVNGKEALEFVNNNHYDFIISDVDMKYIDGFEFFRQAVQHDPSLRQRFLFFSSSVPDSQNDFFVRENVKYLMKPGDITTLQNIAFEIMNSPSSGVVP